MNGIVGRSGLDEKAIGHLSANLESFMRQAGVTQDATKKKIRRAIG